MDFMTASITCGGRHIASRAPQHRLVKEWPPRPGHVLAREASWRAWVSKGMRASTQGSQSRSELVGRVCVSRQPTPSTKSSPVCFKLHTIGNTRTGEGCVVVVLDAAAAE
jgi:hypothetical protein